MPATSRQEGSHLSSKVGVTIMTQGHNQTQGGVCSGLLAGQEGRPGVSSALTSQVTESRASVGGHAAKQPPEIHVATLVLAFPICRPHSRRPQRFLPFIHHTLAWESIP